MTDLKRRGKRQSQGQAVGRAFGQNIPDQVGGARQISQHRGSRRTGNAPVQNQNKQRIQNEIRRSRQQMGDHGLLDRALAAHHAGKGAGKNHGRRAERKNGQIGAGIGAHLFIGPQKAENTAAKQSDNKGKQPADRNAAPGAEGRIQAHAFAISFPQGPRDEIEPAASDHGAEGHHHGKYRRYNGYGADHGVIMKARHKEHICHVV